MQLTSSNFVKGAFVAVFCALLLTQGVPTFAVLEGTQREQLEFLDFSETAIRNSIYATKGRDAFDRNKNKFVRGIKEHQSPQIYEPDVYTWEVAMAEHRKKLAAMAPPEQVPIGLVSPTPMTPDGMLPNSPMPLTLTPVGPQAMYEATAPLPGDAQQRMNDMVYRARTRGLHAGSTLRAEEIKQKLIQHMDSLGNPAVQPGAPSIPALMPAMPDLPPATKLPRGKRGDSYDAQY